MSTKSKRRRARREEEQPRSQRGDRREMRQQDQVVAGELMGAILAAFTFGALDDA